MVGCDFVASRRGAVRSKARPLLSVILLKLSPSGAVTVTRAPSTGVATSGSSPPGPLHLYQNTGNGIGGSFTGAVGLKIYTLSHLTGKNTGGPKH